MNSHLSEQLPWRPCTAERKMDIDPRAHCRRASRPQVLWLELCLLGKKYDLDDHILSAVHRNVVSSTTEERSGMEAFEERREREFMARVEAGAENPVRLWQLLGFKTLNGFLAHRHQEHIEEQARFDLSLQRELPEFVLFGYACKRQYKAAARRARRAAERRLS
jgi:hypothetical protein